MEALYNWYYGIEEPTEVSRSNEEDESAAIVIDMVESDEEGDNTFMRLESYDVRRCGNKELVSSAVYPYPNNADNVPIISPLSGSMEDIAVEEDDMHEMYENPIKRLIRVTRNRHININKQERYNRNMKKLGCAGNRWK